MLLIYLSNKNVTQMKGISLKSLVTGTVIGATGMFFWGATEWFNPLLHKPYKQVGNPEVVNQTLNSNMPESGMYVWPNGPNTKTVDGEAKELVYFIAKSEASFYNPGKFMTIELLTQCIIWLIITYLLLLTRFTKHWARVRFILLVGVLVGFAFFIPLWNWWAFSTEYVAARWVNMLVGWLLAGSAVSYFLRKQFQITNN